MSSLNGRGAGWFPRHGYEPASRTRSGPLLEQVPPLVPGPGQQLRAGGRDRWERLEMLERAASVDDDAVGVHRAFRVEHVERVDRAAPAVLQDGVVALRVGPGGDRPEQLAEILRVDVLVDHHRQSAQVGRRLNLRGEQTG